MDIAEHSMCHPGKPSPHGLGHFISRPGPAAFHSAKSAACRFRGSVSRSRCPSRRLSSVLPESLPYSGNDVTSKYTLPESTTYAWSCSTSVSVIAIISGMCSVAFGVTSGGRMPTASASSKHGARVLLGDLERRKPFVLDGEQHLVDGLGRRLVGHVPDVGDVHDERDA